ncbi:hypothetical protein FHS43_000582 [Streptosporangium becharense]|uniref:CHAP domain-containing protein n=1 Tax=Streptosporangium becharense TaxID=1816182 RepID=A0A7W9INU3_9ACTN|nr:CHAP domain-containing protein [Streptosporangium becharense]MBB2909336.1 hypothetical protein [Streptosporangium becharense]MBB5823761.1 hypothetical protein [Streptosporangium becharense]
MTTRAELIRVIRGELGYRERIDGWTKFAQWYEDHKPAPGFARGPWCQMLISWAAEQAGIPQSVIPRMAYTPYAATWFRGRGRWGRTPKVGALVYFDWGGSTRIDAIDHVGIVTAVLRDGRFRTLEGNTSNRLQEHTRSMAGVAGFAYPNYRAARAQTWTEELVEDLPLIRPGAKGRHPKTIFFLLQARGYGQDLDPAVIDPAVYSPKVVNEVKHLQRAKGLEPDGEVGEQTWPKLLGL